MNPARTFGPDLVGRDFGFEPLDFARQTIGAEALRSGDDCVWLEPDGLWVDVDAFDAVNTNEGLAVVLADVSGKGVSAALLANTLHGMISSQLLAGAPLLVRP